MLAGSEVARARHGVRPRLRERSSVRRALGLAAAYVVLLLGIAFILIPLVWMISTSLKDIGSVFLFPPQIIPYPIHWENYPEAWTVMPFTLFLGNTLVITVSTMVGQLFSCSLVAFGFARLRGRGSDVLFVLLLSTIMLPIYVTLIPTFVLFKFFGWIDTFLPLIVPAFFGGGPFYIFLLRQFFMTIPLELDDAARVDGASTFDVFLRICLPLAKPALATVAIFSFLGHWNDFLLPLIYLHSKEHFTLAIGLNLFRAEQTSVTPWNQLMAVSLLVMIPPLLVFFFAQRLFIQGIVVSGVKG
ncbi:MAG TPA: carbohydrate ABC transporter permease [Chloroflexota bacterium]|nr:carbohydrate ABC transporter permease [Chloroflexota bacterium]